VKHARILAECQRACGLQVAQRDFGKFHAKRFKSVGDDARPAIGKRDRLNIHSVLL
jgi:hypothetical protein